MKALLIIVVLALTINSVFAGSSTSISAYAGKTSVDVYNTENGTDY